MKILLTGGGSGGHFYPLIAVAERLHDKLRERKLLDADIYYMAPEPYNPRALFENNIIYRRNAAGKIRRYASILNFFDFFKMSWGIFTGLWQIFFIFPDVIFGKGGYVSFPALLAAKIFKIPVIIHESDSVPGRTNRWAAKFARRIAISFPEAALYFPEGKVAYTGNPIRKEIMYPATSGAHEYLNLEPEVPVILILGGSQGSQLINESLIDLLPKLVEKYQIIHQTGKKNYLQMKNMAELLLEGSAHKDRYRPFDYLNDLAMRMSAGVAKLVISRAGSTIFEIAAWGIPSIIIPITNSNGDHQRKNAFAYARTGACIVIEEYNLSTYILLSEIDRLMGNVGLREAMTEKARAFAKLDAAEKIADEILDLALEHE
ncbi:MAG: UDP-N-acetylglucosamine--N-acetylmuramyl-(pentapeptide) pyrophosphoryl-undecaprenol N-acetylglucosamine transferase [bacterium]|nr:UDP-N-acetylglucosamine--N-acetylmuramyl-(pentapeptide) pyrophosphoryl-undecaprenol N-acetylglucosamine transferase [bacterium]